MELNTISTATKMSKIKIQYLMLEICGIIWNSLALLVAVQNGTTSLKKDLATTFDIKYISKIKQSPHYIP